MGQYSPSFKIFFLRLEKHGKWAIFVTCCIRAVYKTRRLVSLRSISDLRHFGLQFASLYLAICVTSRAHWCCCAPSFPISDRLLDHIWWHWEPSATLWSLSNDANIDSSRRSFSLKRRKKSTSFCQIPSSRIPHSMQRTEMSKRRTPIPIPPLSSSLNNVSETTTSEGKVAPRG